MDLDLDVVSDVVMVARVFLDARPGRSAPVHEHAGDHDHGYDHVQVHDQVQVHDHVQVQVFWGINAAYFIDPDPLSPCRIAPAPTNAAGGRVQVNVICLAWLSLEKVT